MVALKQTFTIAGLNVEVFSDPTASSSVPVAAFFLLHGRLSSSKNVEHIAESLIHHREALKCIDSQREQRDLIVITFVSCGITKVSHVLIVYLHRIIEIMGQGW
jgi:hypothetical protein